ncbi:hypothetical protein SDC9_133162 [bioreactor metagenome]|uniref:Uncharacterized protein n=1 Tax=bioreactor metagenome TaxID=1076179 RepID=A0A645DA60_9ZZZZ
MVGTVDLHKPVARQRVRVAGNRRLVGHPEQVRKIPHSLCLVPFNGKIQHIVIVEPLLRLRAIIACAVDRIPCRKCNIRK